METLGVVHVYKDGEYVATAVHQGVSRAEFERVVRLHEIKRETEDFLLDRWVAEWFEGPDALARVAARVQELDREGQWLN